MRLWCFLRYLIARLTFFALRLPISRFEREISELWRSTPEERKKRLDETLKSNSPRGENGGRVSSVAQLVEQRPLTKSVFRESASNAPKRASGYSRHTAGTTGDPTHIFLSREELARMLAVRSYCYRYHGIRLGHREARIWGRAANTFASKIRDFLLNRKVFYPAESNAKDMVSDLVSWKPQYVYGYTSLILEAAQIIEKNGFQPEGVKAVICTAESILPAQKRFISSAFGAPVLEEYGSTEFDIIAFECKKGHLHLVNPWLWVESEYDSALITDISRNSQSLVRYKLGDAFKTVESNCELLGGTRVIEELQGRTAQQFAYLTPEHKFHAVVFGRALDAYMNEFHECFKFTVSQTEMGEFQLYVSSSPSHGTDHLKNWVNLELRAQLNEQLDLIRTVNAGEDVMRNGKHTYFFQDLDIDVNG